MSEQLLGLSFQQPKNLRNQIRNYQYYALSLVSYFKKICVLLLLFSEKNNFVLFFQVLGKVVEGSGFEDIVYQESLISSGSLNGVIAGSHYNRSWYVQEMLSEVLERILLTRFLAEKRQELPTKLLQIHFCIQKQLFTTVKNSLDPMVITFNLH